MIHQMEQLRDNLQNWPIVMHQLFVEMNAKKHFCVSQYDVVWYDVVWCEVEWSGVEWCSFVFFYSWHTAFYIGTW